MTMTRVATKPLINILADLAHTSAVDGAKCGVLLHSARGYANPGEPGKSDLLVGTSTTGFHAGHTWMAAAGKVPPMLWHLDDVRAVMAVFGACARGEQDHYVDITRTGAEITVAEDPQLFGETSLRFTAQPLDDYPRGLWDVIGGAVVEQETDAAPRTDLDPNTLIALARIAKRRKESVRMFRTHQRRPVLIEIGSTYRGAATPWRWDSDGNTEHGFEPSTDMYAPKLPAPATKPKDTGPKDAES